MSVAVILGSGLNKFKDEVSGAKLFFEDKNSFHGIKAYEGLLAGKKIILFSGRRHFYEGYTKQEILQLIDISKEKNVKLLIITNAAGGINTTFSVSDLMLITSHIHLLGKIRHGRSGNSIYNYAQHEKINDIATRNKIKLHHGTYCWTSGPMYETIAEMKFLKRIGVDAVGMSTVPEILYCNSLGIPVIGISCITNLLTEDTDSVTSHEEVIEAGIIAYPGFSRLIRSIVKKYKSLI
jgi:purine-nucleoside phosphorylase